MLGWALLRPDGYIAEPPALLRPEPATDAAARALQDLVDAVADGSPDRADDLAPRGDSEAAGLLAEVARTAREARVVDLTARYLDEDGAVDEDGSWYGTVRFQWRFDGFDNRRADVAVRVRFVPEGQDGGAVRIAGLGGGSDRSPVWLTQHVDVRRTDEVLVLAAARSGKADRHLGLASRAIPSVRAVLPEWSGGLVVEVPESAEALDRALGTRPGTYAGIAAVAGSVNGTATPNSPVHIFVNPEIFGRLDRVGARMLMTHEATHVATDAALALEAPPWLVEGFADYVALRDLDVPVATAAAQAIRQVRDQGLPEGLPGAGDFSPGSDHLGPTYELAWLACEVLADTAGEEALVRVYRRVLDGAEVRTVLPEETGLTVARLTARWRTELAELAGVGPREGAQGVGS